MVLTGYTICIIAWNILNLLGIYSMGNPSTLVMVVGRGILLNCRKPAKVENSTQMNAHEQSVLGLCLEQPTRRSTVISVPTFINTNQHDSVAPVAILGTGLHVPEW